MVTCSDYIFFTVISTSERHGTTFFGEARASQGQGPSAMFFFVFVIVFCFLFFFTVVLNKD